MSAGFRKWLMGMILMVLILAIFCVFLFVDVEENAYLNIIVGGLISCFTLIIQFFFRKSPESEKNENMEEITK
jgi:MFS superfamily sulfate permease-like transporter